MFIGITGTFGAGKGTVAKFFVSKGFKHYSSSDLICEYLDKEKLDHTRQNMITMANKLRAQYGTGFIVETFLKRAKDQDAVMESIRSLGEVEELRKHNGILLAVDAPIEQRYKRILKRKSSKDLIDFQTFKEQEESEMHGSGPKQQIIACINEADFHIDNKYTIQELYKKLEVIYNEIKKTFMG